MAETLATTDSDGDGQCDFLEHAFGCSPADSASARRPIPESVRIGNDIFPALRYWQRIDGAPFTYVVEYGHDLTGWLVADGLEGRAAVIKVARERACAVADKVLVRLDRPLRPGPPIFLRVRVTTDQAGAAAPEPTASAIIPDEKRVRTRTLPDPLRSWRPPAGTSSQRSPASSPTRTLR